MDHKIIIVMSGALAIGLCSCQKTPISLKVNESMAAESEFPSHQISNIMKSIKRELIFLVKIRR